VHDDFVAVLVDAGCVTAEDHRQLIGTQPHSAKRPQVMVVEGGRLDRHSRPPLPVDGVGPRPHGQAGQRVVRIDRRGVGREHESASKVDSLIRILA